MKCWLAKVRVSRHRIGVGLLLVALCASFTPEGGASGAGPIASAATPSGKSAVRTDTPATPGSWPMGSPLKAETARSQLPAIPSNFDRRKELREDVVPASAAPDVVGAFRFICNAGHLSRDDPIVYPGRAGAAHLHQFFGNTLTDAASTYESLRTTGGSTCMGPLNRSAYWIPAMMNGSGKVVRPDYVAVYYKRLPTDDPLCRRQGRGCVAVPRGLRFVFGYDMLDGAAAPTGEAYWNCQGAGAVPGHYATLTKARERCAVGSQIGAVIIAPDCWDGVNLDSPDHRSHIAYGSYGTWGYYRCPVSHPWVMPQFTLGVWYTSDASLSEWYLSSDRMPGMAAVESGATLHADWLGAWDDETLATWTAHCIDKLLSCSDGQLGDGTAMNRPAGFSYVASPRLVLAP